MNKIEELIAATKLSELINKKEDERECKKVLWGLAIVGAIAAIAANSYAVYCYFAPDYLEDLEEEFEDEFDDDFFNEEE